MLGVPFALHPSRCAFMRLLHSCGRISAFVYLSRSRYGRIRMRIARPHNAFTAENLRYGENVGEKYSCEREPARLHEKDAPLCSVGRLNLHPYPLK